MNNAGVLVGGAFQRLCRQTWTAEETSWAHKGCPGKCQL